MFSQTSMTSVLQRNGNCRVCNPHGSRQISVSARKLSSLLAKVKSRPAACKAPATAFLLPLPAAFHFLSVFPSLHEYFLWGINPCTDCTECTLLTLRCLRQWKSWPDISVCRGYTLEYSFPDLFAGWRREEWGAVQRKPP